MADIIIRLVIAAILAALGQTAFKMFVSGASGVPSIFSFSGIIAFMKNPFFVFGVFAYGASLLIYLKALKITHLDFAYPLFLSFSAIAIVAASFFFLKEPVTLARVLGILIIMAGIYVVWLSR